jgi:signal transduction histidine kinase
MTHRPSVRLRITLVATVLFAAMTFVGAYGVIRFVENDLREGTATAVRSALLDQAAQLDTATSGESPVQTSFDLVIDGAAYQLGIFDELSEGNARGQLWRGESLLAVLEIDLRTNQIVGVEDPATGGPIDDTELASRLRDLAVQLLEVDSDDGSVLLVGASTLAELDEDVGAVRRALTVAVPALVATFGALIWFMLGRAMRPISAIRHQVEHITTESLDRRVPVPGGRDEVAALASMMNTMLDRLEAGDRKQQDFTADASHELRSPLTVVRTAAETIQNRSSDPGARAMATHVIAEADRMERLVGDLLDLARADGPALEAMTELDLVPVVEDATAGVADRVVGAAVHLDAPTAIAIIGHRDRLERLIANLVDNAAAHAQARVLVRVRETGMAATITVEDDGPGVPAEDRTRVFERFVRLDASRARPGSRHDGAGLGLAIASSIVRDHGGSIEIDESPDLGGARFSVVIPTVGPTTGR